MVSNLVGVAAEEVEASDKREISQLLTMTTRILDKMEVGEVTKEVEANEGEVKKVVRIEHPLLRNKTIQKSLAKICKTMSLTQSLLLPKRRLKERPMHLSRLKLKSLT